MTRNKQKVTKDEKYQTSSIFIVLTKIILISVHIFRNKYNVLDQLDELNKMNDSYYYCDPWV